jgi:putative transcriptional regulator
MRETDFDKLVASVRQAGKIKRGEIEPARKLEIQAEDVKAIRASVHKSQYEFALMIGVSVATLQNWEQGRRQPEGPARALLRVAAMSPDAVAAALDPTYTPPPSAAGRGSRRR